MRDVILSLVLKPVSCHDGLDRVENHFVEINDLGPNLEIDNALAEPADIAKRQLKGAYLVERARDSRRPEFWAFKVGLRFDGDVEAQQPGTTLTPTTTPALSFVGTRPI